MPTTERVKLNTSEIASFLVTLLNRQSFLELLKGIQQAGVRNQGTIVHALVSHIVTHLRSEILSLSDHLMPNVGMSEGSLVRWLAWSNFGKCVISIMSRTQMTYSHYVAVTAAEREEFKKITTTGWSATQETMFKRIAASVFLLAFERTGRATFYPETEPANKSLKFSYKVIEALKAFVDETCSEKDFFANAAVAEVFTPTDFYDRLADAAGYVFDIDGRVFEVKH